MSGCTPILQVPEILLDQVLQLLERGDLMTRQREQQKAWRQANPQKVKEYYDFHRSRPEHRERIKAWHLFHRGRINTQARERYRTRNWHRGRHSYWHSWRALHPFQPPLQKWRHSPADERCVQTASKTLNSIKTCQQHLLT